MKTFKIIRTNTGYMLLSVCNGKARCHEYPTYPKGTIDILLNIGYKEAV
jgi:hypothetical protein